MPGELLFGADAVTPNTSLADGQVTRRSGANLIGTACFHVVASFAVVQSEDYTPSIVGANVSCGPGVNSSVSMVAAPDNNAAQHPFKFNQGAQLVGGIDGSNGATPRRLFTGTSTVEVDFLCHGKITMSMPGAAVTGIDFGGSAGGGYFGGVGDAIGFYAHAGVAQQTLSTGVGHTVDDVITALQALGLVKQ